LAILAGLLKLWAVVDPAVPSDKIIDVFRRKT